MHMFENLFPIDWNAFHFLRPDFLWILIPVSILPLIGILSARHEVRWKNIIAPHLRSFVIQKGNEQLKTVMHLILFVALGCGVLSLAGPTWRKKQIPGQELENPLVLILDLSQSMMATDLQPSRLDRAKFKIEDLLQLNPQARVALIGYAGTAHTIVPLSKDYKIIESHLEGLKPSIMPIPGSDLQTALTLADSLMSVTKAPGTVIIFSDDFENEDIIIIQNFSNGTKPNVIIVPMNTKQGSEIPNFAGNGFLKDKTGNTIYSSLNENILSKLSSLDNVTVSQLTLDKSDMELINKEIGKNLIFKEKKEEKKDDWQDAGLVFIIPMILFLLLWFRKGWVVYLFPLFLFSSCTKDINFADLWYTKDYQGQRLMNRKNYNEAAKQFSDPMHKGVAAFKAGQFEDAIESFKQDTTAHGAYNLGLAYLNNGDTVAAFQAFGYATEKDPKLQTAIEAKQQLSSLMDGINEVNPEEVQKEQAEQTAENIENKDPEDLGGGGQEATKKDMEKQRKEETVATDMRKAKEMDEVPDDLQASIQKQDNSKILMRKVDDDPSLFLKKKFLFHVKQNHIKPKTDGKKW